MRQAYVHLLSRYSNIHHFENVYSRFTTGSRSSRIQLNISQAIIDPLSFQWSRSYLIPLLDMLHVMARYKTESCRKPPRMCRQGYSCPYYHNGKDKRRMPERCFYRSTPCPVVRPADEWLDSALCDAGDACTFCHTRTEQQFHPEVRFAPFSTCCRYRGEILRFPVLVLTKLCFRQLKRLLLLRGILLL